MAETVTDGFGSTWPPCEKHDCSLQVMRPGDARCPHCETEDYIDRLLQENSALRARVAELENNLEMLHFSPPNIGHDAIILRPLFECIEFARWHDGKRESAGTSPNVLGAFDLAIEDADARWFHDANDHDEGKSFYDRRDYKAVEARAEAAESRLTQLEGALRRFQKERGFHDGPHDGLGGMACSECVASYNRAEAELDTLLTPVVKQEEP